MALYFASIPFLLHFLGPESFGLIGTYTLIQAWFNLLDMGFSPMLNRAVAQYTAHKDDKKSIVNLLRSVETILLIFMVLIAILPLTYSVEIANFWLSSDAFDSSQISLVLNIFTVLVFFRIFEGIYRSVLAGLQKHFLLNLISVVLSILKTVISLLIVAYYSQDVAIYFAVQMVFGILTALSFMFFVYNTLPNKMSGASFSASVLRKQLKFSSGLAAITFLSLCLTQVDKVILVKFLTLENFGYFTLAASVASILHTLIIPVSISIGPKLAVFQKKHDFEQFEKTFMLGSEFISLIVCVFGGLLFVYSFELITLWTRSQDASHRISDIARFFVLGNIFNAMMWMPFQAQVAYGWSALAVKTNIISLLLVVPLNLAFVPQYGVYASGVIWVTLNLGYVLVGSQFMFAKILVSSKRKWFLNAVLRPLIIGFGVPFVAKAYINMSEIAILQVVYFAMIAACSAILIIITSKSFNFYNINLEMK